jgi:hypothetical protein
MKHSGILMYVCSYGNPVSLHSCIPCHILYSAAYFELFYQLLSHQQ